MPTESAETARRWTVAGAYWSLLATALVLAVAASTLAVTLASRPFILDARDQVIRQIVQNEAARLNQIIEPARAIAGFISAEPDVVSIALGEASDIDAITRRLHANLESNNLLGIEIFDFTGREVLYSYHLPTLDGSLALTDATEAPALRLDGWGGKLAETIVATRAPEHAGTILIFAPITYHGLQEGTLVAEVGVDLDAVISPETHALGQFSIVESPAEARQGTRQRGQRADDHVERIGDTGTYLLFRSDRAPNTLIAGTLARKNALAVAAAMMVPFLFLALVGRDKILQPYRALQASEMRLQEQRAELSELAAVAMRAKEAIVVTGLDGRIRWVNPAFERLSGFDSSAVIGRKPGSFLQGPDTDPETIGRVREAIKHREATDVEILNYRSDGSSYWIRLGLSALTNDEDEPIGFVAISTDISEERRREDELKSARREIERQALEDDLTGLPNRRAFDIALARRSTDEPDQGTVIIRIDLDYFKEVNDRFGHEAGDVVLREVARVLREETRRSEMPARIGGDEFIILMASSASIAEGEGLARRIHARLGEPFAYRDDALKIGACFGVAGSDKRRTTTSDVVRAADAALYEAKENGRNLVQVYSDALDKKVKKRRRHTDNIIAAFEKSEFMPVYQPIVHALTGQIAGVETLARWNHPQRGLLPPHEFTEAARNAGLMTGIEHQVMERALREISEINHDGMRVPSVSFNVTPERLMDKALDDLILQADLNGAGIAFEVLETAFLDDNPDFLAMRLDLFRDRGVQIEIDDFGSGHASLISVMGLRPDALKIDMRLVAEAPTSRMHRVLVEGTINMARNLGIRVTAEGVETHQHRDLMTRLGCHRLQGFLFAKPMPASALLDYLENDGRPAAAS